jgi:HEPN domain-containing protein
MANRNQLKELALLRRREAEVLFSANLYDGARYLAGYVLELALKARICRLLDVEERLPSGIRDT